MPLGSLSTLGLAGPNGTPLIAELPAPADPAGGVSCAYALAGAIKLPSSRIRTGGRLQDIESFRGWRSNHDAGGCHPTASSKPIVIRHDRLSKLLQSYKLHLGERSNDLKMLPMASCRQCQASALSLGGGLLTVGFGSLL
jgi:hypothetical protein